MISIGLFDILLTLRAGFHKHFSAYFTILTSLTLFNPGDSKLKNRSRVLILSRATFKIPRKMQKIHWDIEIQKFWDDKILLLDLQKLQLAQFLTFKGHILDWVLFLSALRIMLGKKLEFIFFKILASCLSRKVKKFQNCTLHIPVYLKMGVKMTARWHRERDSHFLL